MWSLGPLSPQRLLEWYARRCSRATGVTGPAAGGAAGAGAAGAAGHGGAGAGGTRADGGSAGIGAVGGTGAAGPGGAGTGGTGAAGAGAAGGTGAGGAAGVVAGDPGAEGAGDVSAVSGGAARPRPYYVPLLQQLQPASPLPGPPPYSGPTRGLTERREPESRPASRESCPVSPESRLESPVRTARTVAELVDFAAACCLDYIASLVAEFESASVCPTSVGGECALGTDVPEDRQKEFECLATALPHLVSMLLALEGDLDAPDILTPRSYVPPPGENIVSAMWIFMVKRPPGSPPVFKVCYLRRPPGFTGSFPAGTQWSLRRPVNGLHQAPREWHDTLRTTLAALGFAPSTADPSLFLRADTTLPPFYVLLYVDDLVFATGDTEALSHVNLELKKRYTCTDLGELTSYLGLQITRDRAQCTITLTQSHMVQQVLQRFGFTYSPPQSTPLPTAHSLSAPPSDESVEPSGPYPELVDCLIHRKEHMDVAKRVLRYLCSTSGTGLVLGGRGPVVLTGHSDASWVDDLATQWSSQGYTFSLGSGSVSWRSTCSSSVLSYSSEAEIYAEAMAAQELRWLTYLLTDLGEAPCSPPVLYVDNKAMLALCQEHRLEHRTKHIALRYFLARELQQRGQLRLVYLATQANTSDIFTKALQPCPSSRQQKQGQVAAGAAAGGATVAAGGSCRCLTVFPPPSLTLPPTATRAAMRERGGVAAGFAESLLPPSHTPPVSPHPLPATSPPPSRRTPLKGGVGRAAGNSHPPPPHLPPPTAEAAEGKGGAALAAAHTRAGDGRWCWRTRPCAGAHGHVSIAEDVGAASASTKRRSSKGKGGRGGGGGSGGGVGGRGSSGCPYVIRTDLLKSRIAIFDLEFDAILSAMYALSVSAEGDCYRFVPPDPSIAAAALGASESGTLPSTVPAQALHTLTLDSGTLRCFFRDSTTLTPLPTPVPVRLADPSGGPVVARSSTILLCPAVPSGSLSCLHLPSFSTNLVSTAVLQDAMVTTTTPGGQRVSICTCTRTGRHLATSLPPLPPSPASPCLPCVEGRQRAAPHSSSFPPTSAPPQTLHMDVWGPARVSGQNRERYFLLVVDDYMQYTTVFPLRNKGQVVDVLIPWIRTVRLQLRERFGTDLPVLRVDSSFTLPESPQQNGIAEHRIGLVMEVAHTSMIHAAAPLLPWPFAVQYAAHQLNLWPRVSLPETSPTLRWTGKVGDTSVFRVRGSCAFVCDPSADKLSACSIPCVFLGFVLDARGWQFYHPTSRRVLPSQDVTFDESVPFYHLFPYRSAPPPPPPLFHAPGPPSVDPLPPQGPAPSGVSQVDPLPGTAPVEVAVGSGAAPGVVSRCAASGGAEPRGAGSEGARSGGAEHGGEEPGGAEPEGVELGGAKSEGAKSGGAEPRGATLSGGPDGASPRLSPHQLREWLVRRARLWSTAVIGPGGARTRGTGAAGTGGVGGAGAGDHTEPGAAGAGGSCAGGAGAGGAGVGGTGARGAGAVDPGAGGAGGTSQQPLQPASPLPAPSPYTEQFGSLTERHEPASCPVSPVRTARRAPRSRLPPVPGTHAMALRPSSIPLHVPLPAPPESSLHEVPNPESDRTQAARTIVSRLLSTAVTDPSFESTAVSALIAELLDFVAACRLDYATAIVAKSASASPPFVGDECALGTDVLEDRQKDFEFLAAPIPCFASMLLAREGDLDAPDIPTPCSYTEAITGPYSSQWVKRPPGSPPVFNARYVARGFSQQQGVDYFQTFSPTPMMTTLRLLLHVAAQRDYELHSLDFSIAFLQGSLHEEIWLRRPPGITESFPAGTQWSLRRPVYGLRQAPHEWHDTLRTTLAALGFAPATADPSLILRTDTSLPPFFILVYLDDLFFATADTEALTLVKSDLQKRHICADLGELRSYLGLQITRDTARRTITLTQSHMVHQVLQRFGFQFSLPQLTPLSTSHSLSAPPLDESIEPSGPYPELVGCLIYLMSSSGMGLVLGGRGPVVLTGHADASWVDDSATQRSSQGYTFSLGSGSISWRSTCLSSVLKSSCEAEIYARAMAAQELRWLTYLLTNLGE
ncbi:unnamed protein product [Closterium sp. NIES-53]